MKPTECPACAGDRLHHGLLHGGIQYHFWRWAQVTAAACLDCGVVTTYLDDRALERIRKANGLGAKAKDGPGDDF